LADLALQSVLSKHFVATLLAADDNSTKEVGILN